MEIICSITTSTSNATDAYAQPASFGQALPIHYEMTDLRIATGETTVITGPNGVGKSALLGEIARSCGEGDIVETFFGGRSVSFETENVDQLEQSLEMMGRQFRQNTTRYRQPNRDQQFKSVIRRIINAQTQSLQDIIRAQNQGITFESAKMAHPRPLDTINSIFEVALLPIQIVLSDGTLKAKRSHAEYGIDRLSDGERAALLITGAALVRPTNTFIVVDEPERHLNPAISGALLAALVRARSDVGFVFATHDLQLIQWLRPKQVVHLRDSLVIEPVSEKRRFDLALLPAENDLPEELRYAILGTRQKLLLVEGTATSDDQALYKHIFPDWNVIAKGGCETVCSGVKSLSTNSDYHWLTAVGIIDGDGREESERQALAGDHIHCLPVPTIENLFLHPAVIEKMAEAAHNLQGGKTGAARLDALNQRLEQLYQDSKIDVVARRLVWEGNRQISDRKLSVRSIKEGQIDIEKICLQSLKSRIESDFENAVSGSDFLGALQRIPVKNTLIPAKVAELLGFPTFDYYKRAILRQMEMDSDAGKAIKEKLREVMPDLSTV